MLFKLTMTRQENVVMNELGLTVIRITNEEVEENVFGALNKIKLYLK